MQKLHFKSHIFFQKYISIMIQGIVCKKRKYANKLFCELVNQQFKDVGVGDINTIVRFLIQHNIIRQSIVNRFVVLKIYPDYLERYGKQKAIGEMAKVLPLEQSSIYSILANHYAYFHPNKIDF